MRISELIKDLTEAEKLHGDIEVVIELDIGICEMAVKSGNNFDIQKQYSTLDKDISLGDYDTEDSELYDVDLSKPIEKVLVI